MSKGQYTPLPNLPPLQPLAKFGQYDDVKITAPATRRRKYRQRVEFAELPGAGLPTYTLGHNSAIICVQTGMTAAVADLPPVLTISRPGQTSMGLYGCRVAQGAMFVIWSQVGGRTPELYTYLLGTGTLASQIQIYIPLPLMIWEAGTKLTISHFSSGASTFSSAFAELEVNEGY